VGIGLRRVGKNLVLIGKNRFANPLSLVESGSISLLIPRKNAGICPGINTGSVPGANPPQRWVCPLCK